MGTFLIFDAASTLAAQVRPRQPAEVRAVDTIAEPRPALVPPAAVEEPGVQASQTPRDHDRLGSRDVGRMIRADPLAVGDRQGAFGVGQRLDASQDFR